MNRDTVVILLREQQQSLYVVASGAGNSVASALWSPVGASDYLVGAAFPYATTTMEAFLRFAPDGFCSIPTAVDMALEAAIRACRGGGRPLGLGITAVAASRRKPRGGLRCHIAIAGDGGVMHQRVSLDHALGRDGNETTIREAAIEALEDYLRHPSGDSVLGWERLFARPRFGCWREPASERSVYLPATLNPLHEGHEELRAIAAADKGAEVSYLVCTTPQHKERFALTDALSKVADVRARNCHTVEFSQDDPLFVDKFRQRPRSSFVMGSDTLDRMLSPRWGLSIESVLDTAVACHVKLLVAERQSHPMREILNRVPAAYHNLIQQIRSPKTISSTDIRSEAAK